MRYKPLGVVIGFAGLDQLSPGRDQVLEEAPETGRVEMRGHEDAGNTMLQVRAVMLQLWLKMGFYCPKMAYWKKERIDFSYRRNDRKEWISPSSK